MTTSTNIVVPLSNSKFAMKQEKMVPDIQD
jgi:hypothetical protein